MVEVGLFWLCFFCFSSSKTWRSVFLRSIAGAASDEALRGAERAEAETEVEVAVGVGVGVGVGREEGSG